MARRIRSLILEGNSSSRAGLFFSLLAALAGAFVACGGGDSESASTSATASSSDATTGSGGDMGIGGNFTTSTTASTSTATSSSTTGSGGAPPMCDGPVGGEHTFSKIFGDVSDQFSGQIAVDATGAVYMVGTFTGSLNFGGATLTANSQTDVFLVKFDANGGHVWSKSFGGNKSQTGTAIAIDALGNVLITGFFYDSVNFGGGTLTATSNGSANSFQDAFIAKFDSAGNHIFSKRFGDINTDYAYGIATDNNNNIIFTGVFQTPFINLGGTNITNSGGFDIFVAKYDSNGNHVWSMGYGDAADQFGRGVATDAAGNVYLTGEILGSANFGGGALTAVGGTNLYVTALNGAGQHQWSKRFGETSAVGWAITTDATGKVYVAGDFHGDMDLGGGKMLSGNAQNDDVFLLQLDGQGNVAWGKAYGDALAQHARALDIDGQGNVLMTGSFGGTIDFGDGAHTSVGGFDLYATKISPTDGCPLWTQVFGSPEFQEGTGIGADASGNVFIGATVVGAVDYGGGLLTAQGNDVLIMKRKP